MEIQRYDGNGRYSTVVVHNNTIYLTGQTAGSAEKDVAEQTRDTLQKIEDLLNAHQSDKEHILSARIYLRDMKDFAAMNQVWDAWVVPGKEPTRACVEARLARPEVLVEIVIVAAQR